ncbi:S-adenosylmethionine:tRNA ribosyltransferase-isomerase [Turneriella parva]|uniref:Queuosine biosynthesis protein n=1 Tax=Turneriella parva (strain ATCC BAA-1111 / DSM 21527 / NCTC 11395 / H) TaxID=869212 RepID=I4B2F9_TURPD|nr:S-adenosylmethionine:tRNA ribosyltransferase-isomerase [Turneriella parva]AFM11466.1 Queuosine biosynthesis protein [Turneriella parva DSM 21527]
MKDFWPEEYADLNFDLPEELIATHPVEPADHARLMIIDRVRGTITHSRFDKLSEILRAGDAIFYNATQVEARRVYLKKPDAEKTFECVFLKSVPPPDLPPLAGGGAEGRGGTWQVLMRGIRRLKDGQVLQAVKDPAFEFLLHRADDKIFVTTHRPLGAADFARIGEMPIPPYMRRAATADEADTYQNFFKHQIAEKEKVQGSAASPTAALHFTTGLHMKLREQGVDLYPLCLDIGYGTFAPLTAENFSQGELHAEHYYIPPLTAEKFAGAVTGRKIALGTTSLRCLISYQRSGKAEGETALFVTPRDNVSGIDGLITNFHLPQSSLLLLTAAVCRRELLAQAYRAAIRERYRFYSYGDAMLII